MRCKISILLQTTSIYLPACVSVHKTNGRKSQTACIERVTEGVPCSSATCLCLNHTLSAHLASCVSSACSIFEGIAVTNLTQSACAFPPRDRATPFNVASITLCTLTGIMVFARLIFKVFYSYIGKLGLDDYFIIASIAVGFPCTVINGVGFTRHGLGKDIWTLTPEAVQTFEHYFYVQQILYLYLVATIKLSLLFFYLSIFPGKGVRAVLWLTVAFTAVFGLTFILLSVFQCTPIEFYWLRYVQQSKGHCTRINLLGWIHGGVSVAIDVWMICIPLWQIRTLELHWKKKVGAVIMFLTGALYVIKSTTNCISLPANEEQNSVTVVSALRLQSLISFANSINPTWDQWPIALWSTIEINVGLMCACLPTLRLILVRIWPRIFGSSMRSGSDRSGFSHGTNGSTSFSARKAKIRLGSVDTQPSPISPRLMEANTAFELDAKYPTWDDRDERYDAEPSSSFEQGCHAK